MNGLLKLLRSMRFAIGILAVVAVAATIGSVLEQNQPGAVYVGRYGEFWAAFYTLCGLVDVYHAWWFFALLGFMAVSTALCLWQNTPSMLRDMRSYRETRSLASLRQLEYSCELPLAGGGAALGARLPGHLRRLGYRYKQSDSGGAQLFAARRGAGRRVGYLLVHGAMVLICIGGLIDGNVALRLRLWSGALAIETRDLAPAAVPARSRIGAGAGSFRAGMTLAEGETGASALLPMGDGYLLQELPFAVKLKRFRIAHYANGQPSDFASDLEILDGGAVLPVTLQVNKPFTHRGVTLFQSGFSDGGSAVTLHLQPLAGGPLQRIDARVGAGSALLVAGEPVTLELAELKTMNVFTRDDAPPIPGWHARAQPGSRVHEVGPSLALRVRDKLGQADDWLIYQKAVAIDGAWWFVLGRRGAQQDAMQYVRLPADGALSLDGYRRFVQALGDPGARRRAARALAAGLADPGAAATLETSTANLLDAFAARGYRAVAALVPSAPGGDEQIRTAQLYAALVRGAGAALAPELPAELVKRSMASYSDALDAGLPLVIAFSGYTQVNASGLQLTRAPGAVLVYLGAALLALGVIAMYFVPERRLWLRIDGPGVLLAFAANRPNPALQGEFDAHRRAIASLIFSDR